MSIGCLDISGCSACLRDAAEGFGESSLPLAGAGSSDWFNPPSDGAPGTMARLCLSWSVVGREASIATSSRNVNVVATAPASGVGARSASPASSDDLSGGAASPGSSSACGGDCSTPASATCAGPLLGFSACLPSASCKKTSRPNASSGPLCASPERERSDASGARRPMLRRISKALPVDVAGSNPFMAD